MTTALQRDINEWAEVRRKVAKAGIGCTDKVFSAEDIDDFDPGNYVAWCYDEESNDLCIPCAKKELTDNDDFRLIITHSGGYIDTSDGIQCCECNAWVIEPTDSQED